MSEASEKAVTLCDMGSGYDPNAQATYMSSTRIHTLKYKIISFFGIALAITALIEAKSGQPVWRVMLISVIGMIVYLSGYWLRDRAAARPRTTAAEEALRCCRRR